MNREKEEYQQGKNLVIEKKSKIRLLNLLRANTNMEIMRLHENENFEETEEYIEKLKTLTEVQHQIFSTRRNKNNSKFYEWNPMIGLNRASRRQ